MQIFSTQAAQVDRVNKKRKRADHVQCTRQWSMTSYYAIPKPRRWEILGIISKGFDRELAKRPRADEKDQRVDSFRRGLRGRDKWLGLQMKRLINFRRFKSLRLCPTRRSGGIQSNVAACGGCNWRGDWRKKPFCRRPNSLAHVLLWSVRHRSAPLESSSWCIWFEGTSNSISDPPPNTSNPPSYPSTTPFHTVGLFGCGAGVHEGFCHCGAQPHDAASGRSSCKKEQP